MSLVDELHLKNNDADDDDSTTTTITTVIESRVEKTPDEEPIIISKTTTTETIERVTEKIEIKTSEDEKKNVHFNLKLAIMNSEELTADSVGYLALRKISEKFDGNVLLVGRNSENGNQVINDLNLPNVEFYQLDSRSTDELTRFAAYLKETYGGVDILINNFNLNDENSVIDVIETNYKAVLNVFNALFLLMRSNARIVNVSSRRGLLKKCNDRSLRSKISSIQTIDDLNSIINDYIESFEDDTTDFIGFPSSPFDMSKLAVNVLTKIQQKNVDDSNNATHGIIASSICPEENETEIVNLSFLPDDYNGAKGGFFIGKDLIDWETGYFLVQNFN